MTYRGYDNFKRYISTDKGREAKNRATRKYRQKLAELYGVSQTQAIKLHKENKDAGKTLQRGEGESR